jgi:hypothetical protein
MRLRIPGIENASFEDLWRIQQDEWVSFDEFRRSIQLAVETAAKTAISETDLAEHAKKIQRELIEGPLARLEDKLRRIEQIRRKKWKGYRLISYSTVLVSALVPGSPAILGAIGTTSVAKLMETYFSDIEKDVPLHSEALYWLACVRRQSRSDS